MARTPDGIGVVDGWKLCVSDFENALLMAALSSASRLLDDQIGLKCTLPPVPTTSTTMFLPVGDATGFTPNVVTTSPRMKADSGRVLSSGIYRIIAGVCMSAR